MVQPISPVQNYKNMSTKEKVATVAAIAATTGLATTGAIVGVKKGKFDFSKLATLKDKTISKLNIAKCNVQVLVLNGAAKVLNGIAKIFGK